MKRSKTSSQVVKMVYDKLKLITICDELASKT